METFKRRETFTSAFGQLMTMIGVAVGLGAVWRFPYMVGRYGGASFVLFYLFIVLFIAIPALMAEWMLGRFTQRGTLGAFDRGNLPAGKFVGGFLFFIVFWATGYYSNVVGWVGFYGISNLFGCFGLYVDASIILPPEMGFDWRSFLLQFCMTAWVIFSCGFILVKGLRKGIERASKVLVPLLFFILLILIVRSVTLEGAEAGLEWILGGFRMSGLTPDVMAAAMGMAFFSLSLGGTFMVIYGSYLGRDASIRRNALYTGIGASLAGILAGLAIFPAVFAIGLEPSSGPRLLFDTIPEVFHRIPAGMLFGFLFFAGLFGAAYLSDVAAFEVLVGGIVDNSGWNRKRAVSTCCGIVLLLSVPPMINTRIFVPWDLTFGSGMQAVGSLLAVITSMWCIRKSDALKELSSGAGKRFPQLLYWWMRLVVPATIAFVGMNWFLDSVLGYRLFR